MKDLVSYILPVCIFALMNGWIVFAGKRSFGSSLPVTLIGSVLITYFGQLLFHTFSVGVYFCIVCAVGGIGLLFVKRKDKKFMSQYFSTGFQVFIILCIFFLVVDFRRYFASWDELSHWGKMVKEMIRIDRFYAEPQSNLLVHKEYPPFAALFEMLWCRLTGEYREGRATMALHVLEYSLVVPMTLERIQSTEKTGKVQKILGQCAVFLTVILLTLYFNNVEFNTIYTDLFLPLFYVFLISVIANRELRNSGFGLLLLLMGQFGLVLAKQMSIAYVMLVWFFYSITEWMECRELNRKNRKQLLNAFGKSVALLIVPAISYAIWNHYTGQLGLSGQFSLEQIKPGTLWDILRGGGSYVQHITYVNYVKALLATDIGTGVFEMSYVSAAVLALCILGVMAWGFRNVTGKGELLRYGLLFILGSVGYAFTMFVLYMFCYSEAEMRRLASYHRYMDSYIIGQFLILFLLFISLQHRKKREICGSPIAYGMLGIAVLMLGSDSLVSLVPQYLNEEPMYGYRIRAEKIEWKTESDDKIFLISSDNCANMYYLNYYLEDRRMDERYLYSNVAEQGIEDVDYWHTVLECIREDDYVYVYNVTDNVNRMLGMYTEEGVLQEDTVYRIHKEENGIQLEIM